MTEEQYSIMYSLFTGYDYDDEIQGEIEAGCVIL